MATISKRILAGRYTVYQVKIRRKGYPPLSKVFDRYADAQLWASTTESEMLRRVWGPRAEAERTTIHKALERYREEISPHKRGGKAEQSVIRRLLRTRLSRFTLATLRSADLAEYVRDRLDKVKPATVMKEIALLSHLYTVPAKRWGMAGLTNPVHGIEKPSLKGNARTRRLEPGEEQELLARAKTYGEPMPSIIVLALETAMRRGEIAGLRWEDIDFKRNIIHLAMTKNGDPRDVPLSSRAIQILRAMPRNLNGSVFNVTADAISQAFARLTGSAAPCKQTEVRKTIKRLPDLRFHDLRHEATSRLFERGLNPMQVSAITGHKTLGMLKRYTHLRAEDLARMLG